MNRDAATTILDIKEAVADLVAVKGWDKVHNARNLATSIALEVAELMEIFQWANDLEVSKIERSESGKDKIVGEIADMLIYIVCLANYLDVDISTAIREKIEA